MAPCRSPASASASGPGTDPERPPSRPSAAGDARGAVLALASEDKGATRAARLYMLRTPAVGCAALGPAALAAAVRAPAVEFLRGSAAASSWAAAAVVDADEAREPRWLSAAVVEPGTSRAPSCDARQLRRWLAGCSGATRTASSQPVSHEAQPVSEAGTTCTRHARARTPRLLGLTDMRRDAW